MSWMSGRSVIIVSAPSPLMPIFQMVIGYFAFYSKNSDYLCGPGCHESGNRSRWGTLGGSLQSLYQRCRDCDETRGLAKPPASPSLREEQTLRTGFRLKEAREGLETEKTSSEGRDTRLSTSWFRGMVESHQPEKPVRWGTCPYTGQTESNRDCVKGNPH